MTGIAILFFIALACFVAYKWGQASVKGKAARTDGSSRQVDQDDFQDPSHKPLG